MLGTTYVNGEYYTEWNPADTLQGRVDIRVWAVKRSGVGSGEDQNYVMLIPSRWIWRFTPKRSAFRRTDRAGENRSPSPLAFQRGNGPADERVVSGHFPRMAFRWRNSPIK